MKILSQSIPFFLIVAGMFFSINFTQLPAATLVVPTQFSTIQGAINAAQNGDTVIVQRGTYFENINFRGKAIVVASQYLLTNDPEDIAATIINGSTPVSPDTASCVVFGSHEDTTSVIAGFTLTGGRGTVWQDIHNHNFYREGGGVLSDVASPTIRNNYIVNNSTNIGINNTIGVTSSGGGGIRCGDGNPRIYNNVIMYNSGHYGGGIVLNYTGAVIRNNIIYNNTGGEDFGGGGIWSYENGPAPQIVENNTILNNHSVLQGGGVKVGTNRMTMRNNIIWGNTASAGQQIFLDGVSAPVTFCDVQGGFNGAGNISIRPLLNDTSATLSPGSPCIDAGNSAPQYNDPEDGANPGFALSPAWGTVRNDIGAYGGPRTMLQPHIIFHLNAPVPPSAITAYGDYRFPTKISLSWHDPDTTTSGGHLTNFRIRLYRDGAFVADVDSGVQAYQDSNLVQHQQYKYYLRAVTPGDSSLIDSATAYAGGSAYPMPPASFSATDRANGILLQWTNPDRQDDNTPLNDLATIYIFRDGNLFDSLAQASADTGLIRTYLDTTQGFHTYHLQTADNELPVHRSVFSDPVLGCGGASLGFSNSFETGAGSFFRTGLWDTTSTAAYDGNISLTDSPSGNTSGNDESYCMTPNIVVPARGILSYRTIAITKFGTGCYVDISTNHRASFTLLHAYNSGSHPEWQDGTADPGDWFEDRIDLSSFAGDTITLRFRIASVNMTTGDGWYIDALNIFAEPLQTSAITFQPGWNMVSLPVEPERHETPVLFPWAQSKAYSYAGGYHSYDTLKKGQGYWLKADSARGPMVTGLTIHIDTLWVTTGWNIVGGISSVVDTGSAQTSPAGIRKTSFYGYDGAAYHAAMSIEPGKAYWVKFSSAGRLILSAPLASAGTQALSGRQKTGREGK